jgi:recombination protein RecA
VGVIEKTGTWYSYKGERLSQGKENVKKLLKEKVALAEELDREIRKKVGLLPSEPSTKKE